MYSCGRKLGRVTSLEHEGVWRVGVRIRKYGSEKACALATAARGVFVGLGGDGEWERAASFSRSLNPRVANELTVRDMPGRLL